MSIYEEGRTVPLDAITPTDVDIVLGIATVDTVWKKLIDPTHAYFVDVYERRFPHTDPNPEAIFGPVDDNHPLGQWTTYTSPENPAVIFESGAAFCSPVITFDEVGRALHYHPARIDDSAPIVNWDKETTKRYLEGLPRLVSADSTTSCVAGLNGSAIWITDESKQPDTPNPIDTVIDTVQSEIKSVFPHAKLLAFVSKHYPN